MSWFLCRCLFTMMDKPSFAAALKCYTTENWAGLCTAVAPETTCDTFNLLIMPVTQVSIISRTLSPPRMPQKLLCGRLDRLEKHCCRIQLEFRVVRRTEINTLQIHFMSRSLVESLENTAEETTTATSIARQIERTEGSA